MEGILDANMVSLLNFTPFRALLDFDKLHWTRPLRTLLCSKLCSPTLLVCLGLGGVWIGLKVADPQEGTLHRVKLV